MVASQLRNDGVAEFVGVECECEHDRQQQEHAGKWVNPGMCRARAQMLQLPSSSRNLVRLCGASGVPECGVV